MPGVSARLHRNRHDEAMDARGWARACQPLTLRMVIWPEARLVVDALDGGYANHTSAAERNPPSRKDGIQNNDIIAEFGGPCRTKVGTMSTP